MNKLNNISITRRFVIDAGHRIFNHEGKCKSLHGHRYEFHVTCTAPELDSLGRVIDFSVIKERVGTWLNEYWDHAMLLYIQDPIAKCWEQDGLLNDHKLFLMPVNPSIENLCWFLLERAQSLLSSTEIKVKQIIGYETENCYAKVEG